MYSDSFMEVILQEDIPTLGKAGEIVKVREGYGRNFLLPTQKAILADRTNLKELEHHKKVIASRQAKANKEAIELKGKIEGTFITISKEVGEEEKLFGSVTSIEIAETLRTRGFSIDKKMIHLEEPIKTIGTHEVQIRLKPEVHATVKVIVAKK